MKIEQLNDIIDKFIINNPKVDNLKILLAFLNDISNITIDYPTKPGEPNLNNIKSTGEKAFQRAIINNKYSILDFGKGVGEKRVNWLDIEIPVTLNQNPRRNCIDLIGDSEGELVLCELKYNEKSVSNHPIYAVFEILIYFYFILNNYINLDKHKAYHSMLDKNFSWQNFIINKNPFIIVAANEKYWNFWFGKINKNILLKQVKEISHALEVNVNLFRTKDEDFLSQKLGKDSYKPIILENNNWEIIEFEI